MAYKSNVTITICTTDDSYYIPRSAHIAIIAGLIGCGNWEFGPNFLPTFGLKSLVTSLVSEILSYT